MAHAGPPPEWALDDAGRPVWIAQLPHAETAPWRPINRPRHLPLSDEECVPGIRLGAMPQVKVGWVRAFFEALLGEIKTPEHSLGAPPLPLGKKSEEVRYTAWLADVRGQNEAQLAHWLRFDLSVRAQPTQRKVARYLAAGRRGLHDDGVLPWVLWPEGVLPVDWSVRLGFVTAVAVWYRLYVKWNESQIALLKQLAEVSAAKAKALTEDPNGTLRRVLSGDDPLDLPTQSPRNPKD